MACSLLHRRTLAQPVPGHRMTTQGSLIKGYDYLLKFLLAGDNRANKGKILETLQDCMAEYPIHLHERNRV